MIQLYNYIKNELNISAIDRQNLLRYTESLLIGSCDAPIRFDIGVNLHRQMSNLITKYLFENQLVIHDPNGSYVLRDQILIGELYGFKVLVALYKEIVCGLEVPIERFVLFDTHSQVVNYHQQNQNIWNYEWTKFVRSPLTCTLINNADFLFSNSRGTGYTFEWLSVNEEVFAAISSTLVANRGTDATGTTAELYNPLELNHYKGRTAELIALHRFNGKLQDHINSIIR